MNTTRNLLIGAALAATAALGFAQTPSAPKTVAPKAAVTAPAKAKAKAKAKVHSTAKTTHAKAHHKAHAAKALATPTAHTVK